MSVDPRPVPIELRHMTAADAAPISRAFLAMGQVRSEWQFLDYVAEREVGIREAWVATWNGALAGIVTLHWNPLYAGIAGRGIPEIQDLMVLLEYRRRGVATRLLDLAEHAASTRAHHVAIGVGLHPGYNAAQRLYVLRGYVPDGLGVTYDDRYVEEGEMLRFDDLLVLHLIKSL
ncbi:MAG TPA: GNAT family N-acetyltransferase [Polyangiaceae bacterium]|nr:GNAT family N-acetyltransferase [Polyangiaceae bacterium]